MSRSVAIVCVLSVVALTPTATAQPPTRPNILLIVLDDTGTEQLDIYGQPGGHAHTPVLDSLRQSGVMFTNAYGNPLCGPTRTMIQSGRYAFRTGMGANPGSYAMPGAEMTIAEMLRAGFAADPYACGAFGKWHLATSPNFMHPINNGYDRFDGPIGNVQNHFAWTRTVATPAGFTNIQTAGPPGENNYTASVTRSAAQDWILAQTGAFFAYVCFNPPHVPWQVPPLTLLSPASAAEVTSRGFSTGQSLTGANRLLAVHWMIEAVDTEIGNLLAAIPPATLQNTYVLVMGDNGTTPQVIQPPFDPQHAKGTVYQLGTRIPLVVAGPGVAANATCTALVDAVDLWRTVADLTGAQLGLITPLVTSDSMSFAPLLAQPSMAGSRGWSFVQAFTPNGPYGPDPTQPPADLKTHDRGLSDGTFKYIRKWDADHSTYLHEAYDLTSDPQETVDLYPAWLAGDLKPGPTAAIAALIQQMEALSGA